MHTLVIQHIPDSVPPAFTVIRHEPYQPAAESAAFAPPDGFPVEGLPNSDLRRELRWYLETFFDYPFHPETGRAERVLNSLKEWGEQAFRALFGSGQARDFYRDATRDGHESLRIRVTANDPRVLAWPWEALYDPQHGYLAHHCHVERQISSAPDPLPLPEDLPRDRINILLVTARPFEGDVHYRSISRPLVELIAKHKLPAEVTLLRPPTIDRLGEVLRERRGYFHLLHFDGHGGYGNLTDDVEAAGALANDVTPHSFSGPQGCLVFETPEGEPYPVPAKTLGAVLREHRIPAVVLNACQSATIDDRAESAFASVAAASVQAGVRSVVAMGYSLYVSGAQQFMPAFYRRLFETGNLEEPTRMGRQQMLTHPERICARGTFPLQDWLVPVVYQQQPADFRFLREVREQADQPHRVDESRLPEEARDAQNPYGFIGRDGAILELERAMHRPAPAILVHGLGGVGKTTLARGFLQWLEQTNGLGAGCLWFTFNDTHSVDFVLNRIGDAVGIRDIATWSTQQKLDALGRTLHENCMFMVWDNFESASGNESAGIDPLLSDADRRTLADLLGRLRGGKTKVIITSRIKETWLSPELRRCIELGGLHGEERWEFLASMVEGLGVTVDREDEQLRKLMDTLGGHPLLMRAVLPRLESESAAAVLGAIQNHIDQGDPRTTATLRFIEEKLPDELRPLLVPLALHERFADAHHIEHMAKTAGDWATDRTRIDRLFDALAVAGLVRYLGQSIFELHPALSSHLRTGTLPNTDAANRDAWGRAFVDTIGQIADALNPRPLHERRALFYLHEANFQRALGLAERLRMDGHFRALTNTLANYAMATRNFDGAQRLWQHLAAHSSAQSDEVWEAIVNHSLGMIAEERRAFDQAETWYLKSLAISKKLCNVRVSAANYHNLGNIAAERRDFGGAEGWYCKSLAIKEKLGDEVGAASTYHHLGVIAEKRRDLDRAEECYRKSLEIHEKFGDEHGAAANYHHLGVIAQERRDFDRVEGWYRKSLAIKEKLGDKYDAANTYHNLGFIAQERRDFDRAEEWYRKSLEIHEKLGAEYAAATAYHNLGSIAQERRDFDRAEEWCRKSLEIHEKFGDEHGAAVNYDHLGVIAAKRRDFDRAEECYRKSLEIHEKLGDGHTAASIYSRLGIVATELEQFEQAGRWLIKSIQAYQNCRDEAGAERNTTLFLTLRFTAPHEQQKLRAMWDAAGFGPL